jgi:hypothetical protein
MTTPAEEKYGYSDAFAAIENCVALIKAGYKLSTAQQTDLDAGLKFVQKAGLPQPD